MLIEYHTHNVILLSFKAASSCVIDYAPTLRRCRIHPKLSLIWINFDLHALLNLFHKARGRFVADKDEIRPQYQRMDAPDANAIFSSSVVRNTGLSIGDTIDKLDAQVQDIYGMNELAEPWYSDQILPFDITLAGANEYGARAAAKTCVGACRTRVPAAASPMPEPRGRLRS